MASGNLDISAAKTMLLDAVKWRKNNNINEILKEDWSDLEQDFPASFDTQDKMNRPIATMEFSDWDFRSAVLTGKSQRLNRYLTYIIERMVQNVFKAQEDGKSVTRALVLLDLDGFSIRRNACPACMPVLIRWAITMESYYPQFTQEIIFINAPSIVQVPFNVLRSFVNADTRDQLKILGSNKEQWMKYLDERVDRNQRTQRYGGTKPS